MAKITIIDGNDEIELSTAPKENIKAYMVKGEPGSDGTSPTASISKSGDITTITVTDKNGTTEADVLDGYNPTVTASKTNKVTTITINDINGTATTTINDGIDLTGGVPTNGVIGFDGTASQIPDGYEVTTDPFGVVINNSYNTSNSEVYSCDYINSNAGGSSPTGSITIYAGATAPTGYLICDGTAISRNTYADLFNVIGTSYGTGDDLTTFNLPNLKGKVVVGLDSNDSDFDTLGETGGEKTHTLTRKELPAASLKILDPTYSWQVHIAGINTNSGNSYPGITGKKADPTDAQKLKTEALGSGQAHNNMQPYIVLNYIIKY